MSAPIPHFELPWKASTTNRLTFTYPTGGVDYNVDIDAPDAFDDMISVMGEIASQLSGLGVTEIWPVLTETGFVKFRTTDANFDLDLSTAGSEVQAWMGFTTGTFSNVASATSDNRYLRAFWPGRALSMTPTLSRSKNLLQAQARAPTGHSYINIVPMSGLPEGFVASRFGVDFLAEAADFAAVDQVDTPWYRLLSFLSGAREAFNNAFDGGWYSLDDLATSATWTDPDALRERGACEHKFAYFTAFVDSADYLAGAYSVYLTAVEATRSYWWLHPDTSRMTIAKKYDGIRTVWETEFFAFGEAS